jgi:hypothetical protein
MEPANSARHAQLQNQKAIRTLRFRLPIQVVGETSSAVPMHPINIPKMVGVTKRAPFGQGLRATSQMARAMIRLAAAGTASRGETRQPLPSQNQRCHADARSSLPAKLGALRQAERLTMIDLK